VVSLGEATVTGRPALVRSLPLVSRLATFAKNAGPVGLNLDRLTKSFDRTGGIERLMDYIFFQVTAINGFDGVSHYLRAGLLANLCSAYATAPAGGCNSNFTSTGSSAKVGAKTGDPQLDKLHAALANNGKVPQPKAGAPAKSKVADPFTTLQRLTDPKVAAQRRQNLNGAKGAGRSASPAFGPDDAQDQALDYLLGGDK
jgi:hypothetical protein